jgi:hypothetical protein
MAEQSASIQGRRAEIPAGERRAVETGHSKMPPDLSNRPLSPAPAEPGPEGSEMEAALFEEARSSAPRTSAQTRSRWPDEETLVTPEMEAAFIEEAYAAQAPPDPVAETPPPPPETTTQEQEEALFEPPPPEVDDVSSGVLPPRPSVSFLDLDLETTAGRDIQEPEEVVEPIELPDRQLTEEEKAAILSWLTDEKLQEMQQEIVSAYDEIRNTVAENETLTNKGFNNLIRARDILLRRDVGRVSQAEYYIEQTQALLRRIHVSQEAERKYQLPILAWGILWAVAYLSVLVLLGQPSFVAKISPTLTSIDNLVDMPVFVAAMAWGGIGSAVAVLYSLFKHIGARDFDPHYSISYLGKPFLGAIIGATAYIVLNLMIRVLGMFPADLGMGEGAAVPFVAPGVIYVVAWAGGFKENRILDLVDRVMKRIFSGTEGSTR